MAEVSTIREVSGRAANKIIYFYKRIDHEPTANKMHILGLQGATSTTHQRTLSNTATKTANIKGVGSANEQFVVDVIFQDPKGEATDLWKDLYMTWEKQERIAVWRVDFNTVTGTAPSRKVRAAYAQCYIANLPSTEALGATMNANITFEVNGIMRAYDNNENAYHLNESDLPAGVFDDITKFYNFSHGNDIGTDGGVFHDGTKDDSKTGEADQFNEGAEQSGTSMPSDIAGVAADNGGTLIQPTPSGSNATTSTTPSGTTSQPVSSTTSSTNSKPASSTTSSTSGSTSANASTSKPASSSSSSTSTH